MLMCDLRGVGSVSIDALMKSDVFSELLRLHESDVRDAVVAFPAGCVVELPSKYACDPGRGGGPRDAGCSPADDDALERATVVSFENDGNLLTDVYAVKVHPSERIVKLPRACLYWCPDTTESLPNPLQVMDNWFALPLMYSIYDHFVLLDRDADGVLTESELQNFSNGSFTKLAISRVFDCFVPQICERAVMDYKGYLNFVIATEHPQTKAALKYVWSLLDIYDTRSKIDMYVLKMFCKEIAENLIVNGLMTDISTDSILTEVIDMINPASHEYITPRDVETSKQQSTILPILLNFRNFYAYDCREQTAAMAAAATEEFV
jgi:Ca2+-binding EF-hand superfamily protein